MLDGPTKLLQVTTAIAAAWVAVFNVGFFARVGYQFLGVMDVSSLLYTFGLAFIAVLFFSLTIVGLFSDIVVQHHRQKSWWAQIGVASNRILGPIAIIGPFLPMLPVTWWPADVDGTIVGIFYCLLVSLWRAITAACRYQLRGRDYIDAACWCVALLMLASFLYGGVFANGQMKGENFEIILKSKASVIGKLVRTSTSGVLVFTDKTMRFYPLSEIALISHAAP